MDHVQGKITYLDVTYQDYPNRDKGKYRYIQLNNYSRTFELFVGKDAGDFKPKMERVDSLQLGDIVTVYFDDRLNDQGDPINRLVYFIDKENKPFFVKGSWEKGLAWFLVGLSLTGIAILVILKRKGKIT